MNTRNGTRPGKGGLAARVQAVPGGSGRCESPQGPAEVLEGRLQRRVLREIVRFLGIIAQPKELFANVSFTADVSPIAFSQGSQRPAAVAHRFRRILSGSRGTTTGEPDRGPRNGPLPPRRTHPNTGPANSRGRKNPLEIQDCPTIVAARSRRLTVSVTTRPDECPDRGGRSRGGHVAPSGRGSCHGETRPDVRRSSRHGLRR